MSGRWGDFHLRQQGHSPGIGKLLVLMIMLAILAWRGFIVVTARLLAVSRADDLAILAMANVSQGQAKDLHHRNDCD